MSNTITPDALLAQMRAMIEQSQGQVQSQTVTEANPASKDTFSNALKLAVDTVNSNQQQAAKLSEAFQNGDPNVQMSEVMVALQKSNVSFCLNRAGSMLTLFFTDHPVSDWNSASTLLTRSRQRPTCS